MTSTYRTTVAALAFAIAFGGVGHADFMDVDLSGWEAYGDLHDPMNSSVLVDIGAGSQVEGLQFIDLQFESFAPSWRSELTLSVEASDPLDGAWDWRPASTLHSTGTFGPTTDFFGGTTGSLARGGPFSVNGDGMLKVFVYELFDDAGVAPDSIIHQGTMRISYVTVPEPALVAILVGVCALAIRSRFWG